ncbi:ABC transporter ATP-binding protein [Paraburkholderia elongata]|uniref:ATP-binding cassette domain-containing protein n=1 Tax=Paraburkholderia elongata TaxID=2675747 RepID=A0A972P0J6_9BURK|nr:ABC transporter ATP-binding protein [Paraburkholderia elongata]NPT54921.1 ATP-binding cassette domain-containing protein [Paraburkholderia elongata]NPT60950.1 ATP-binding cassette domain-containing protein [Paraburkholderia elongata]
MSADIVLQTRDLKMAFGGLKIFDRLNFSMRRGERHAIIGPNGAGKSTFVNLVTGLLKPTAGHLLLDGRDVTDTTPHQRVRYGLVRTFQINTLFPALNPLESVVLALCQRQGLARPSWRPVSRMTSQIDEASALLNRFGLLDAALTPTQTLSYGEQRVLEVVLAFAMRPRVLLLDEPAAGLSTAQGVALFDQLSNLAGETTVLFIEHDMHLVFRYADRVSVFAGGDMIAQGTPDEVRADERVRKAYLGS